MKKLLFVLAALGLVLGSAHAGYVVLENELEPYMQSGEVVSSVQHMTGAIGFEAGANVSITATNNTIGIAAVPQAERVISVFDGGTLEYPHTLDLSDGAEQAFVKGASGQIGTFVLALPAADPDKVGHLTVYADMDPPAGFYFDLSAANIVSRSYPAEKPWLDAEAPSTWKFEFESILGSAGWYYLKATEYITE